jgi:hypothetical protein
LEASVANTFRSDYEQLGIDDGADWAVAQKSYKRLVHVWHPDRYSQRPRERVEAQQKFIELTKSFNNLRTFYRANDRLPYQRIELSTPQTPKQHQQVKPSEACVQESSLLQPRKPGARPVSDLSMRRRLLWLLPGVLMLAGTLALFIVIDRKAKQRTVEQAREVLRQTSPSEFMPSSLEIKKQSSRGAFIERDGSGQLGDQLMKDVFR